MATTGADTLDTASLQALLGPQLSAEQAALIFQQGQEAVVFALLTAGSFWATRSQTLIDDRQFIDSMIPHHSGAILMCREAKLADSELKTLCDEIMAAQREEIDKMTSIRNRL